MKIYNLAVSLHHNRDHKYKQIPYYIYINSCALKIYASRIAHQQVESNPESSNFIGTT